MSIYQKSNDKGESNADKNQQCLSLLENFPQKDAKDVVNINHMCAMRRLSLLRTQIGDINNHVDTFMKVRKKLEYF
jgi:hypothetical protein